MQRKWLVLLAVSLMFCFVTGSTFMSMGVVLYSMIADLHWSQTAAGTSFSVLGLAVCFSSPLPAILMNRIGSRWTMCLGGALLTIGFACAYLAKDIWLFYVAMGFLGIGFSLSANITGVYLLASWFPNSSRIIGAYLMFGAFGGVIGPPFANAVVSNSGHWQTHWLVMSVMAAVAGLLCLVFVRDRRPEGQEEDPAAKPIAKTERDWNFRDALIKPQFMITAAAMVFTEACVTTLQSAGVTHLANMGNTAAFAAYMLSMQSMMATIAKGAAGTLSDYIPPKYLLAFGLCLECIGMVLLSRAGSNAMGYAFALAFGIGWGTAYLAVTVILINYFGPNTGSSLLSTVWLLSGVAAAGPAIAGVFADHTGSFSSVFWVGGIILLPIAFGVLAMRTPRRPASADALRAAERSLAITK